MFSLASDLGAPDMPAPNPSPVVEYKFLTYCKAIVLIAFGGSNA
jgi:hypothetical protein